MTEASADPFVREYAAFICRGLANNDLAGQVSRITGWIRQNVTYIRDPAGQEYLIAPQHMLRQFRETGAMLGDCDDHVMLLNSLLGSVGFDTVCLGVKHGGSNDYNHVISGLITKRGLVQIDPCQKDGNERIYPNPLRVR